MISLGNFGNTSKLAVTSDAATFEGVQPWSFFVVHSNRAVHLKRVDVETGDDADTTDFHLMADEYARVEIPPGGFLSFVLATAETDGDIYITPAT
ncbi:hypothetical protein HOU00_gp038 [Caulobacter phage CcrPW]|uniref:Uncharacterized protein n=1 Tax=Caulobacter phage CcrPW TaxID=2283271 RepID=A0A385ECN5_9CAUD|nr:hypothetical protein HOU00_gp038 [Caulobacter phage CcrPW]AXQ68577.1 hypothetical protein CcrPW_gp038 [Caulobacter phage CcrPW]